MPKHPTPPSFQKINFQQARDEFVHFTVEDKMNTGYGTRIRCSVRVTCIQEPTLAGFHNDLSPSYDKYDLVVSLDRDMNAGDPEIHAFVVHMFADECSWRKPQKPNST